MVGDMFEILTKLLDCDYPVQWEPKIVLETVPNDMVHRLTDQLNEKVFEDDFYFEHLMLYVGLSYEYTIDGRIEEAVKIFETGENELREFIRALPSNMNMAVQHIMSATRAYLLLQQNSLNFAVTVISEIPFLDSMNTENRATLCALRAVFFDEYGISGTKRALELASKAIDMNPNEPMWYFLKGKYLGRLRRVERPFDIPEAEEIEFLKKANDARENASYIIFTAQMYCETANRIYRRYQIRRTLYPSTKILIDNLNQESLKLYDKAIELKPNCPHTMFRCAKGFIKLLAMICDQNIEKRTRKLLEDGLKLAPENGYGNHVMAQYYERIRKDPIKALKFLRICESKRIFGAVMDLLRLEYRSGYDMDFVQRLTDLLNVYEEKSRKCQVYSQLISYYIFVTDDLKEACTNTYAIMDLNPNCDSMLEHRAICIRYRKTFNLYELLVDEIKIRLQDEKCFDDKTSYYRKFLSDLSFTGQSVSLTKPRYLKNEILNAIYAQPKRPTSILGSRPVERRMNSKIPQHVKIMATGLHTVYKTDVDQSMNEIFTRCQEELDKKDKNKPISTCRTSPHGSLQSAPTPIREEYDNSENTAAEYPAEEVVHPSAEEVSTAEGNEESDESDDDAFRMIIYGKMKGKSEHVIRPHPDETADDASNVIVPPLEKLKIGDESPKISEIQPDYDEDSKYPNEFDSHDGKDDDESLNNIESEFRVTETVLASANEKSDKSDDDMFRMVIHKRTSEQLTQDLDKLTINTTIDIVTPLKKLKIAEE